MTNPSLLSLMLFRQRRIKDQKQQRSAPTQPLLRSTSTMSLTPRRQLAEVVAAALSDYEATLPPFLARSSPSGSLA
jgi:hypothetical protein